MSTKNISDLKTQKDTLFPDTAGAISAADLRNVHEDELDSAFNRVDGETFRVVASPTGDASGYVITVDYPTAYTDEIPILFKAPATNSNGNSFTIKINSLAALPVYTVGQAQVANGTLIVNRWYSAIWSTDADGGGTDGFIIIQASNTFGDGTFDEITDGAGTGPPNFPYGFDVNNQNFIGAINSVFFGYAYQLGNELVISGSFSGVSIAAMSTSRIAYIDDVNEDLRVYDYDASTETWSQTGSDLNISGIVNPAISALDASSIAYIDPTNDDLRKYTFNGSTWSQVGNDLNITTVANPAITALDASSIAYIDSTNADLRKYSFDGTDWSQVGNDLNISGFGIGTLASMSSNRIAAYDGALELLRVYDFDGTNWAQAGNSFSIYATTYCSVSALDASTVAFSSSGSVNKLQVYRFDGTNWALISHSLDLGVVATRPAVTAISSNRIAYIDGGEQELKLYEFPYSWSASPPAPPF